MYNHQIGWYILRLAFYRCLWTIFISGTDLFYVYFDHLEYPKSGMHLGSDKTFDECLELCRQDTANDCRKFVRRNWTRDNCWRVTTGRKYQSGEMYTQNKGERLVCTYIRSSCVRSESVMDSHTTGPELRLSGYGILSTELLTDNQHNSINKSIVRLCVSYPRYKNG